MLLNCACRFVVGGSRGKRREGGEGKKKGLSRQRQKKMFPTLQSVRRFAALFSERKGGGGDKEKAKMTRFELLMRSFCEKRRKEKKKGGKRGKGRAFGGIRERREESRKGGGGKKTKCAAGPH